MRWTDLATATIAMVLAAAGLAAPRDLIDAEIRAHDGLTGSLVLERGEHALLARAWLVDNARRSIEVQYFIWSTDNIGILASEALLRAAQRGVAVRVLVDDLLVDAPDETLLALAHHPNVDIRIYNPVHSVGVPWYRRLWNLITDFRGANQRMHDKTLIVDGELAITGGRNMADEYFDYDHSYNFRDRDALVIGAVVPAMRSSFERFWASPLAVPVEQAIEQGGDTEPRIGEADAQRVYGELAAYAAAPANFAPEVRAAIDAIPDDFAVLAAGLAWGHVDFISDEPGKNEGMEGFAGGGLSTAALAALLATAEREVLIQSPYVVLSEPAFALFRELRSRGVQIRISTNSLASTDNLQAFSGYLDLREELIQAGIEVFEYKPDPAVQAEIMARYAVAPRATAPVFAVHAKTLVVDRRVVYVGTYNLDPRSENLNTEVGVVIHDVAEAAAVAAAIDTDMLPANSWGAGEEPDRFAPLTKRVRVWLWSWLPLEPLL